MVPLFQLIVIPGLRYVKAEKYNRNGFKPLAYTEAKIGSIFLTKFVNTISRAQLEQE